MQNDDDDDDDDDDDSLCYEERYCMSFTHFQFFSTFIF